MNQSIFNYFYSLAHNNVGNDQLIIFLATGFNGILIALGILYVMFHKEGRFSVIEDRHTFSNRMREIFIFCTTGIFSWFVVLLLKRLFTDPRPFEALSILPLFNYGGMDSFPSGHAAVFGALSFGLLFMHRSVGAIIFTILALAALLSRIAAGIHYPIDILVGLLVGLVVSYLIHVLFRPTIVKKAMVSKNTKK